MGDIACGLEDKAVYEEEPPKEGASRKYVPIRPAFRPLLPKSSADAGSVNRGLQSKLRGPRLHSATATDAGNSTNKKRRIVPSSGASKSPSDPLQQMTTGELPSTVAPANLVNKRRKLPNSSATGKISVLDRDSGLASPPLSLAPQEITRQDIGKQVPQQDQKPLYSNTLPVTPGLSPADPFEDPLFCAIPFNNSEGQNTASLSFEGLPLDSFTDQFLNFGSFPTVEDRPDHFDPMEFFGPAVDIF